MANYAGPYIVEIKYSVDSLSHVHRCNTSIATTPDTGEDPANIDLLLPDATTVDLESAVNAYIVLLKVFFSSDVTFNSYDLYFKANADTPRQWKASGTIGVAGTASGTYIPANQFTLTYRTAEGGIMRQVFLETVQNFNTVVSYAGSATATKAFMDFVSGATSWILARDTSYPIVPLNSIGGQNESTFRARYR